MLCQYNKYSRKLGMGICSVSLCDPVFQKESVQDGRKNDVQQEYLTWRASQVVLVVKYLPANARDLSDVHLISRLEGPLEEGVATHSSVLAWRIPQRSLVGYSP